MHRPFILWIIHPLLFKGPSLLLQVLGMPTSSELEVLFPQDFISSHHYCSQFAVYIIDFQMLELFSVCSLIIKL